MVNLATVLIGISIFLVAILIILLLIPAQPTKHEKKRKRINEDISRIKEQIDSDEDN